MHVTSFNVTAREIGLIWLNQICVYYQSKVLVNLSAFLISCLPYLEDPTLKAADLNQRLMDMIKSDSEIQIEAVVDVLLAHLRHNKTETRLATLNWIRHFHAVQPNNVRFLLLIIK